jgi:hypothetical protein
MTMPATATKPLKPATAEQCKCLYTLAHRHRWSKAELYDACGVESSLKELSVSAASAAIDRLQCGDHRGGYEPPPPDRARLRHTIRNATARQRSYIQVLLDRLGWPDAKARGWLWKRHGIRGDLDAAIFSSAAASQVILELEAALRKLSSTAGKGGDSDSV